MTLSKVKNGKIRNTDELDTKGIFIKSVPSSKVEPFIDGEKYLCLVTKENRTDSLMVGFMKYGPFNDIVDNNVFLIIH